ncbi:MAG TPA: hypothetical protein VF318_08810 [Dehalococcoidales bacterium]
MIQYEAARDENLFKSDPRLYIEKVIKEYVATSPINRLTAFNNAPMWGEPTVVFADGDDPIFNSSKMVIDPFHMTPREVLEKHIRAKHFQYGVKEHPDHVCVVSYTLPIPLETRLVERDSPYGGSARINNMRWLGENFWRNLENYLCALLEVRGFSAVDPARSLFFERKETSAGTKVNWSERHIAYCSGLGTFGLNGLLITPNGCATFIESIVCDLPLRPTGRPYHDHNSYCLFYQSGSCRKCIERCQCGAISEKGRDILICREHLRRTQPETIKKAGLDHGYVGMGPTCGRCMTGVPCEERIP